MNRDLDRLLDQIRVLEHILFQGRTNLPDLPELWLHGPGVEVCFEPAQLEVQLRKNLVYWVWHDDDSSLQVYTAVRGLAHSFT